MSRLARGLPHFLLLSMYLAYLARAAQGLPDTSASPDASPLSEALQGARNSARAATSLQVPAGIDLDKLNAQFDALRNSLSMEDRQYRAVSNALKVRNRQLNVHQQPRPVGNALAFEIQGIGFDLIESDLWGQFPADEVEPRPLDEPTTYNFRGLSKVDRLSAQFIRGKLYRMIAEWDPVSTDASLENIKKKLTIRLGPNVGSPGGRMSQLAGSQGDPSVTVWDFTDIAVDRRFELSQDAETKRIVLEVTAPSVAIDVDF